MQRIEDTEDFVRQLTENQNRIYGYVYSLLGDRNRAADVVQETNLVLWRKIDEYRHDQPFLPWAFAIARFQVLAHLRNKHRDRLLLDPQLVDEISDEAAQQAAQIESIRNALGSCLERLTTNNRRLVEQRYFETTSISDIAAQVGRTTGSIKVALLRIRRQLAECVQKKIASER